MGLRLRGLRVARWGGRMTADLLIPAAVLAAWLLTYLTIHPEDR